VDVLGLGPEGNVSGGGRIVVGVWCVECGCACWCGRAVVVAGLGWFPVDGKQEQGTDGLGGGGVVWRLYGEVQGQRAKL
jgi:hypothetical protein